MPTIIINVTKEDTEKLTSACFEAIEGKIKEIFPTADQEITIKLTGWVLNTCKNAHDIVMRECASRGLIS